MPTVNVMNTTVSLSARILGRGHYPEDDKPYGPHPHASCDLTRKHSNTSRDQNRYFIQDVEDEIHNVAAEDAPVSHPCRSLSSTYLSSTPPDDVIGSLSSHDTTDQNLIGQCLSHDQESGNFIGSRSSSYCSACLPANSNGNNEELGINKSCASIYEDSVCYSRFIGEDCTGLTDQQSTDITDQQNTDITDQHHSHITDQEINHSKKHIPSGTVDYTGIKGFPSTESCFDIYFTPSGSISSIQTNLLNEKTKRINTHSRLRTDQSDYSFEQYTTPCSTCEDFQKGHSSVNQILDKAVAADKTLIDQFPNQTASVDILVDQIARKAVSVDKVATSNKTASVDNILICQSTNKSSSVCNKSVDQTRSKAASVDNLFHKIQAKSSVSASADDIIVNRIPDIIVSAEETSKLGTNCDIYNTVSDTDTRTSSKHSISTAVSHTECRPNFDVYLITGSKLREYKHDYKQQGVYTDTCSKYDASDIYTKSYPTDPDLKSHVRIPQGESTKKETSFSFIEKRPDIHTGVIFSDKNRETGVRETYDSSDSLAGSYYTAKSDSLPSRFYHHDENFVSCQDFQEIDNRITSRFSKAHLKDVFNKGRNFVKNKLENYRRRLPDLKNAHQSGDNSVITTSCGQTCGFSCVHFAKEISQSFSQNSFGKPAPGTSKGGNLCTEYSSEGEIAKGSNLCAAYLSPGGDNCENVDGLSQDTGMISKEELEVQGDGSDHNIRPGSRVTSDASIEEDLFDVPARNGAVTSEAVMTREATLDDHQDDLPVGTEAMCLPKSHYNDVVNGEDGVPTGELPGGKKPCDKRLRWVSAVDKTQGNSMNSSITSNTNSSVDDLLQQREMDPETLLNNLGFGCSPNTDQSYTRIPDRFLAQPSNTGGVDLYDFVIDHQELHHLLPIWENQAAINRTETGSPSTAAGAPASGKDTWGRARTFSSVLHGVRFIKGMQAEVHRPPAVPEPTPSLASLPSILDIPNRTFLAQQGYYGCDFVATTTAPSLDRETASVDVASPNAKPLSAKEKRKQFHHAVKSARSNNWSFTDDSDENVVSSFDTANTSSGSDSSFEQGLRCLRSFSNGICSESSEDNDSFETQRQLVRQKSMRALRQQYQETIRQSMDGDIPVFDNLNDIDCDTSIDVEFDQTLSTTDRRKVQVSRLMASIDDDGDCLTISKPAIQKSMFSPLLKWAQHSTQSTLTSSSPGTPNEPLSRTDNGHFTFPDLASPKSPAIKPVVSITVDETDSNFGTREITPSESKELAHSLVPLLSAQRSDSCHTLVSQDSSTDHDVSGDVTPHPRPGDISPGVILQDQPPSFIDNKYMYGDALSESTSSSGTLNTMIVNEDLADLMEPRSRPRSPLVRSGLAVDVEGEQPSLTTMYPPQESFELEEISSTDNTFDESSACNRNRANRGPMEKSASTHSDSSGFVDLDTPGEPQLFPTPGDPQQFGAFGDTQHFIDTRPDDFMLENKKLPVSKSKTFDTKYDFTMATNKLHDDQISHSLLQLPVSSSSILRKTVQRATSERFYPTGNIYGREYENNKFKHVHVCKKESFDDLDADNQNPTLTSISVVNNVKGQSEGHSDNNRSLLYTIHVPSLEDNRVNDADQNGRSETKKQYVSTMNINVSVKTKSENQKSIDNTSFTLADETSNKETLQVNFSPEHDLPVMSRSSTVVSVSNAFQNKPCVPEGSHVNSDQKQSLGADVVCSTAERPLLPSNVVTIVYPSNGDVDEQTIDAESRCKLGAAEDSSSFKKHVLHKRRSKESLIASHNQTADWLLSNQREEALHSKQGDRFGFGLNLNKGKQMSSSTPNLRDSETQTFGPNCELRKDVLTFYFPSTNTPKPNPTERKKEIEDDTSLTEIKKTAYDIEEILHNVSSAENSLRTCDSLEMSENVSEPPIVMSKNVQDNSALALMSSPRMTNLSKSKGESLGYYKLARLTNAPISMLAAGQQRFPLVKYQPYRPLEQVRKMHNLNKLKHLEAETSLMQHALQRYKVELTLMETMLLTTIASAGADLDLEDRAELDDLRSLWTEVKKEVSNMEVHLCNRLTSLRAGNDQFSPFNAMSIVQSMIDLLREQLYQQQMCLYKDVDDDDFAVVPTSIIAPTSPSASSVVPQTSSIQHAPQQVENDIALSQARQKEEMEQSFIDLKETIVREVKDELHGNTKWLQLQLQSRDNEIQRLKMELFMQRVNSGETRKRETFESDV